MPVAERSCPACHTPLPEAAQFCMHCGTATPTDPGVPPRTATTGAVEVAQVTRALSGRYRIERVLGEGGMATVYLAEDARHKRKVAVKVMRPELAATLGADRFLREVEIAARLQHPHILPLYDSGESEGLLFFVMPHVEGESLKERLARDGALPADEALRYAREIADALAYAHGRGVVHRDIKPANILLSNGHALVADFGIARAIGDGGGDALTKTGLAVGTPQYMAPEQATGERDVDGRADVYATGAVLYEMLAGTPPFTGDNARAVLTKSLTERPRPLATGALDAIVQKALAKAPAERYESAGALVTVVDQARVQLSSGSVPALTPREGTQVLAAAPPARARLLKWGGIAAVAALALWALGATVLATRGGGATAGGQGGNRIAVVPFDNQGAASDEYFAEGIADEVRGKLARVSGLSVTSSATVAQFKASGKTPQAYGQDVGADYVLTGRVRWAAGAGGARRVQVVPELVDVRTGDVKWQQSFDTELDDVFEVQSQIATRVAGALGVAIGGSEEQQLARRPTENVEAYQLFLRGRAVQGADVVSLRESSGYFEQAVALDSTFADAWASLAVAMSRMHNNGNPTADIARRAREALDQAQRLAPDAARTRVAAASYHSLVQGDLGLARAEMDLALRSAPTDADVLARAGLLDQQVGDLGSALAKLERAREIDPRSYTTLQNLGQVYLALGRAADAEGSFAAALLVRPGDLNAIQWVALSRVMQNDLPRARAGIRAAMEAGVPAPTLAAHFAGYQETAWVLEERERQLVFRLRPSVFDDDLAFWGQSLAMAWLQAGDRERARAYADSALAPAARQAAESPPDSQLRALHALTLALAGRGAEARAVMDRVLEAHKGRTDPSTVGYNVMNAARMETVLGDRDRAVAHLVTLRRMGSHINAAWLALDPTFASLKGHPGFEALLQQR